MTPETSLLEFPERVMTRIFDNLDFLAILNLQKTCHNLRKSINNIRPASKINGIFVEIKPEEILFFMNFDPFPHLEDDGNNIRIRYKKQEHGVLVSWKPNRDSDRKIKFLEDSDILSVFSRDFEGILKLQTTVLRFFYLLFYYPVDHKERYTFKVYKAIQKCSEPLKSQKIHIKVKDESEILETLPFFDPNSMESLKIDVGRPSPSLELQDLIYLEQWWRAKEVALIGCTSTPEYFENFEKVEISNQTLTENEVFGFENILIKSRTLTSIWLKFQNFPSEENFIKVLGPPDMETAENGRRKCKILWLKTAENVIKIELHEFSVKMTKLEFPDVPEGVESL